MAVRDAGENRTLTKGGERFLEICERVWVDCADMDMTSLQWDAVDGGVVVDSGVLQSACYDEACVTGDATCLSIESLRICTEIFSVFDVRPRPDNGFARDWEGADPMMACVGCYVLSRVPDQFAAAARALVPPPQSVSLIGRLLFDRLSRWVVSLCTQIASVLHHFDGAVTESRSWRVYNLLTYLCGYAVYSMRAMGSAPVAEPFHAWFLLEFAPTLACHEKIDPVLFFESQPPGPTDAILHAMGGLLQFVEAYQSLAPVGGARREERLRLLSVEREAEIPSPYAVGTPDWPLGDVLWRLCTGMRLFFRHEEALRGLLGGLSD